MSTQNNPEEIGSHLGQSDHPAPKKFDAGFVRNVKIVGGVLAVAVIIVFYVVFSVRNVTAEKSSSANASIPLGSTPGVASPTPAEELSPAELERVRRVQEKEAEDAANRGKTYIPTDISASTQKSKPDGPGIGYQMMTGDPYLGHQGQYQVQSMDPQRASDIRKGIEVQLSSIVARNEAPGVGSAGAYQPRQTQGQAAASISSAVATAPSVGASATAATGNVIVPALRITGARLASPVDTSVGEFASAEVEAGPLAGAYMIGTVKMSTTEKGVTISLTQMTWKGKDYKINAVALDPSTSAYPVGADIDRKLMQRFVLPVVFSTAQAYANAMARPAQTVVVNNGQATVVTPAAAGKEAAAAGVAAGMAKAGEASAQAKATAYMPANTPLPIIFLEPVMETSK